MNKWERVRRSAREFRQTICEGEKKSVENISSPELVRHALAQFGLQTRFLPPGHPDLPEKVDARVEGDTIYCRNDVDEWLRIYYQLHEIAHLALGHGERDCAESTIDPEASESTIPFGVHRVEGYGPEERIECEANIFAREFLLPREVLKNWFVEEGLRADRIAERSGMGVEMVFHQLAFALLTPDIPDRSQAEDDAVTLTLNHSQRDAAHVTEGPQLVDAGPGTGKTRTLVGRVLHLLATAVPPENILILTFSNKAVEELRARVHKFAPDSAGGLTIETFHSFGLELLRKYGTRVGLPEKPEVLDPVEAVVLLENALPDLELDHYQYLPEPSNISPTSPGRSRVQRTKMPARNATWNSRRTKENWPRRTKRSKRLKRPGRSPVHIRSTNGS